MFEMALRDPDCGWKVGGGKMHVRLIFSKCPVGLPVFNFSKFGDCTLESLLSDEGLGKSQG